MRLIPLLLLVTISSFSQVPRSSFVQIDSGWAKNSINAVIFRKGSLASLSDYQFAAFYSADGHVVIAKRKISENTWQVITTGLTANVQDAHNAISIAVDGAGYLHMAWDHHNSRLRYVRGAEPYGSALGNEIAMTGVEEDRVTYPEFHRMPNGDLLFFYRNGMSGNGNLNIKRYDVRSKTWRDVQRNLIDGEGERNAYWQTWVDDRGYIHVSWVWRESPDVASNHDVGYAMSKDGGLTWLRSDGKKYQLPITERNTEYVVKVPQGRELINQTSMTADNNGNPIIATYWRDSSSLVPQYRLIFRHRGKWIVNTLDNRATPFSLSGVGTKRIPISRPQVVASFRNGVTSACLIFRDAERGNHCSVAMFDNVLNNKSRIMDIDTHDLGQWEPTFDVDLWKSSQRLAIYMQSVEQGDHEKTVTRPATPVGVLEWKPFKN